MKHLIVLTGPTGVGKTELSLSVAEFLHSPVINADSRQLYAELPIGTAAPTPAQQARVEHRFVGTLKLTDYYSAARYEEDVMKTLDELYQQQDYALLSGGSMMYIDAVCKGIDDIPTVDKETRRIMLERYQAEGLTPLANELRLLDPTYYNEADIRNPKRVIHALEICYMTGKPYSSFRTHQAKKRPFHIIKIGLQRDREELYRRINDRVENMVGDGLVEEALKVQEYRTVNALNTVGYKEIFKYIDGEWTLDYAKEKIKQNTRIYSRKQMTWFRRDADMTWFQPEQTEDILNFIAKSIR
ncbi:MAG: tRNA (adenosine(37)-N6)-dimethylallyltransferase MiaA [Paraprevotella sp.]|nr:tRNA (adenosine(37)-N6)-dimethylallyltransferase MiaA [Paraprevotella sp.]